MKSIIESKAAEDYLIRCKLKENFKKEIKFVMKFSIVLGIGIGIILLKLLNFFLGI